MPKPARLDSIDVGDTIIFTLMPEYRMKVLEVDTCETDSVRNLPHRQYRIIDFTGREDWLCAYDVMKVLEA